MKIVRLNKENFGSIQQTLLKRSTNSYPAEEAQVAAILQDVRERGDEALFSYTERFDHAAVTKETVLVTPEEVAEAYEAVDPKLLGIIRRAIVRIRAFHEHEKEESWFMTEPEGMVLGQRVTPLASAGVYVPGGKAVYPSSVIMNIIPAKVAGVRRIVMCTPPGRDGKVAPTFDPQLSGGALYDMNLYNIYLAVGLFGAPEDVAYYPNLGYNGVDISGIAVLSYPKFKAVCIGTKDTDGPNAAVIQGENGWMRMDGKPNVDNNLEAAVVGSTDGQRAMQAGGTQGQVRLSASGSVDRTFTRHYYEAEKVHHRMCAEFKDFARIIDRKEDSEAQDLLQKSLMVMDVLEKARKFAGIRFGCDG